MEGVEPKGNTLPGCLSAQHGSSCRQSRIPACERCGCDGGCIKGQSQPCGCEQAGCCALRAGLSLSASLLGPAPRRRRQAFLLPLTSFLVPSERRAPCSSPAWRRAVPLASAAACCASWAETRQLNSS